MRVAIAGFGIGGAALSIALARDGHEVTVYEQAATLGPVGAGFLLQPSGQDVLAEIGLLDEVEASAWPIRRFRAESAPGRILSELRYDRGDPTAHALGVSRGRLFTALQTTAVDGRRPYRDRHPGSPAAARVPTPSYRSRSAAPPSPHAICSWEPTACAQPFGGPSTPTRDSSCHRSRRCGGSVRRPTRARTSSVSRRAASVSLRATCPSALARPPCSGVSGRASWKSWRTAGFTRLVERVGAALPEAGEVFEAIGSFDRLLLARYGHATVRRTHTARIVLIGDAAHASPPHLGQGANLALLDAAALAAALRASPDLASALAQWDRSRWFQNVRYALLSRALSPFFQSSRGWLGPARDLGLPIMSRLPPTRAVMERVLAGRG